MIVAGTIAELHRRLAAHRSTSTHRTPIGPAMGLVPTMGALHAGHGSLIETSVRDNEYTVVSNFVNPSQFNDPADFARYPRDLATDNAFCESLGADLVFAPSVEEMYPREQQAFVDVGRVTQHLEGEFRPGHFRGVATVVMKLLQIVQPSRVYFGEKDAQQLAMIQRMVEDLNVPVKVIEVPTVRESDGLAMSSRNRLLDADSRAAAPLLYKALKLAACRIADGIRDAAAIRREALAELNDARIRVEYFELADPVWMEPVEHVDGSVRIVIAAYLGGVRLIDNVLATSGRF